MTSQEYSTRLGIRLVCHLKDDREQAELLGACVSRNWLKLRDQNLYTRWRSHAFHCLEGCFRHGGVS